MKKLFVRVILFLCASSVFAVEYNCNIIGKNIDKAGAKNDYAIFDGNEKTYL